VRRRLARRAFAGWSALAIAATATVALAVPAQATTPMYLGAVGESAALSNSIGVPIATHAYAQFSSKVPTARMITVRTSDSWATVAAARPGSALYDNIVRWAQTLKGRSGPVMLAYHHEPEASGSSEYGTPAEFINAYRQVVSIFRAQGVTNVEYTWQMTAWSFRAKASDPRHAAKWYPGDAYVDNVGADAYNWFTCGHGAGRWNELSTLTDPVLAFARAHGKPASLPEFASHQDARRAQWVSNAHDYLVANGDIISAAFYFNRGPTNPANSDCSWQLETEAEFSQYGEMARNTAHFTP